MPSFWSKYLSKGWNTKNPISTEKCFISGTLWSPIPNKRPTNARISSMFVSLSHCETPWWNQYLFVSWAIKDQSSSGKRRSKKSTGSASIPRSCVGPWQPVNSGYSRTVSSSLRPQKPFPCLTDGLSSVTLLASSSLIGEFIHFILIV